jgi:1-acyl-sn-glycerol-3-phosphate acyltransferase
MDARTAFHLLLLRPLLKLIFGLHVQGARQLEELDQFLIVANHNSHLDTLLLMSVLPRRRLSATHPVAAADHFGKSGSIVKLMDRLLAPVWIDRGGGGEAALEAMDARLAAGGSLILFPEGSRGDPGEMQRFRSGVGRLLARHPNLPVIPAHILGPERALPRGAALPLPVWNRVLLGPARHLRGQPRNLAAALEASVQELARAEGARRQQRRLRRRDTFTVAALGIDGSGKSTLARNLALALSASGGAALIGDELRLLEEGRERDLQPLSAERLRRRLSRRAKSARSLAGYKIPKLAELLLRDSLLAQSRRWYDPAWVVMDGSPLLNLTAWSILYREDDFDAEFCGRALGVLSGRERLRPGDILARRFPLLRWLQRLGLTRLEMPDAAVFMDLDPNEAVGRINSRGESKQVHETPEKLAKLRRAYLAVCEAAESRFGLPVLRLDGRLSPEELTATAEDFMSSVKEGKS